MNNKRKYALIGSLAGLANGFFGTGGGLFLVPLLIGWVKMDERHAFATSVAVVLPLCIVSACISLVHGNLSFIQALPYLIGGIVGGLIAGTVFKKVSSQLLRRAFGLLLLYGGVRALFFA